MDAEPKDERGTSACRSPSAERCAACGDWVIRRSLLLNVVGVIAKGAAGVVCGSQALVADSLHSLADVVAFAINYVGHRGPRGIATLGGVFIAALTFLSGVWILAENTAILIIGEHARPGLLAVVVAGAAAFGNWHFYRLAKCAYAKNPEPSILVCTIQNRTNCLASVLATTGLLLSELGLVRCDPIFAIAIGFFLFGSAAEIFQWALRDVPRGSAVSWVAPLSVVLVACALVAWSIHETKSRNRVIMVPASGLTPSSPVDDVLGRSHCFLVFDTTTDTVTPIVNQSRHVTSDLSEVLLGLVREHDVDVVLAEKIGAEMYDDLTAAGVRMYYVDGKGSAGQTVTAYLDGQFHRARAPNAARGAGRSKVRWLKPW